MSLAAVLKAGRTSVPLFLWGGQERLGVLLVFLLIIAK